MPTALKIFTGNSNKALAYEIAGHLGMECGNIEVGSFPEGEIRVKINENVRGADVFVVQSTCSPVNDSLMELLIMIDAFKRASAQRITAVIPYYGYARQDRKDQPRVPITAKLTANLITVAGADRLLTMDLHAGQIQGFFDIPVDHLKAAPVLSDYFKKKNLKDVVVASTDVGGIKMARDFAERLGTSLAIVDKRRMGDSEVEAMSLIGDVKGKNVVIPDDMIATAGTLLEATRFLKKQGALDLYATASHAVFAPPAISRIKEMQVKEIVVTDTVPIRHSGELKGKVQVLSVAPLFADVINRIHKDESVSTLFQ